jgi:phage replication O-like protein O
MTTPSHEPHPKNGHVRLPNEVVEALARLRMSGSQAQIIWAVMRKTLGWQRSGEWNNEPYPISLNDLNQATGVSRRQLLREIEALTRRYILTSQPRKGKAPLLSLNLDVDSWEMTKLSLVTELALEGDRNGTSTGDRSGTSLVSEMALVPASNHEGLKKPKETLNKQTKETGVDATPPIKTGAKSKPYQVQAGIFLDLVEQRDTKIINRGKAIKAARAIFTNYPETTPEKLYECFAWLRDNDSFLHNKEPPAIISFMPDKYPAWLAGKLKPMGGETHVRPTTDRQRPQFDIDIIKSGENQDGA